MEQAQAIKNLHSDLRTVSSHLTQNYGGVFEEEMSEYYPFEENTLHWLKGLYESEKYQCYSREKLNLLFEKDHPFLFVRDMAFMNAWNRGYRGIDRKNHITGLMFSGNPVMALESTLCICRPSLIQEPLSQWFDFKQAMNNLELTDALSVASQAWKGCGLFYLYFQLSEKGQDLIRDEIRELVEPYLEALEISLSEGCTQLKKECRLIFSMMEQKQTQTLMDGFYL